MRKIFTLIIITATLYSCNSNKSSSNNTLDGLFSQKKAIKLKIQELNKQLIGIDTKIEKLDTIQELQSVSSLKITQEPFKHYVKIQGNVNTDQNIKVYPEISGIIKNIYVKEGQYVAKNQLLLQIDNATVLDNITEIKTQLNLAETTFNRQNRLWKQKIGSEIEYLKARTEKENLENKLKSLRTQLDKTEIRAPFSGTVDEIFPKMGELTSTQTPLLRLINLNNVYVDTDLSEDYITTVKKNNEVIVVFPSLNKTITSKVNQISKFIDPNNRSFKVRINLINKDHKILPNLIAKIQINDFQIENGISIPTNLVLEDQSNNYFVYLLIKENKDYKVKKQIITKGLSYNNKTLITKGLQIGDLIVNKGARGVKNNQKVKLFKN